jgi:hypothetical protein
MRTLCQLNTRPLLRSYSLCLLLGPPSLYTLSLHAGMAMRACRLQQGCAPASATARRGAACSVAHGSRCGVTRFNQPQRARVAHIARVKDLTEAEWESEVLQVRDPPLAAAVCGAITKSLMRFLEELHALVVPACAARRTVCGYSTVSCYPVCCAERCARARGLLGTLVWSLQAGCAIDDLGGAGAVAGPQFMARCSTLTPSTR